MDIVISRVTSPTVFTSSPRNRHARRSCSARSPGRCDPTPRRGGHEQRPEHVGEAADPRVPPLDRVGVVLGELGELVVVLRRVVVLHDAAPVGERQEVRAGGDDAIAVALQLQVAQDRVGHQAHDVAERRDLELGRLRPRRHRVGGAARLVPGLEHERARARLGEVGGRDQPVVAAARSRSRRTVRDSWRQDRAGAHPGGSRGGTRRPSSGRASLDRHRLRLERLGRR